MILQFKDEYRWLSNFWPSKVTLDGVTYPSVENAYQAAKTVIKDERKFFVNCTSGQAKRRGKEITQREDWPFIKIAVMRDLLIQKFRDPILKQKLIDTGDQRIREGNNWNDKFWGVDIKTREGENNLGKIIMRVRQELRGDDDK